MRAGIAMAALIDDEGAAEMGDVEFVGAQQIDEVDLALLRAVDDAGDVAAAFARQEAQIERRHARGRGVQNVESVPAAFGRRCRPGRSCRCRAAIFAAS